jgi:hypothetical protein
VTTTLTTYRVTFAWYDSRGHAHVATRTASATSAYDAEQIVSDELADAGVAFAMRTVVEIACSSSPRVDSAASA